MEVEAPANSHAQNEKTSASTRKRENAMTKSWSYPLVSENRGDGGGRRKRRGRGGGKPP
jgi:hypothetical protein